MLQINYENQPPVQWHLGSRRPETNIDNVKSIQADGGELDFIRRRFVNIILPRSRVAVWWGDLAKTILANI